MPEGREVRNDRNLQKAPRNHSGEWLFHQSICDKGLRIFSANYKEVDLLPAQTAADTIKITVNKLFSLELL